MDGKIFYVFIASIYFFTRFPLAIDQTHKTWIIHFDAAISQILFSKKIEIKKKSIKLLSQFGLVDGHWGIDNAKKQQ